VIVNKEAKEYLIKKLYEVFSLYDFNGQEKEIAKIFKALSHPWAVRILEILVERGEAPYSELAREIYKWKSGNNFKGKVPAWYLPRVHEYMKRLEEVGFVESRFGLIQHSKGKAGRKGRTRAKFARAPFTSK
jgi:DNA-binding transcriptional ArsR family regulator